jgi:hypothetical protein
MEAKFGPIDEKVKVGVNRDESFQKGTPFLTTNVMKKF